MADITMCEGTDCNLKHDCYRFLAVVSEHQSYFTFTEMPFENPDYCTWYWKLPPKPKTKEDEE